MLKDMSLKKKIGQMIITGLPGTSISPEFISLVENYGVGNVILFSHNTETCAQVKSLCDDFKELIIKNTGIPPFITVDQEGGMVSRMPQDGVCIPGAMAVAATGKPDNARTVGRITAGELLAMGINCNIAPVLDINSNNNNPVIGVRSYGDKKEAVAKFGLNMMNGLLDGGVMPVVKHFPGHGDTAVDSHLGLPSISKTFEELKQNELVPFIEAINNGAPCVMSSHILFPSIEPEKRPATMSKVIITDILKNKLGFKGLVFTDCLEMDAIAKYYGTAQGAVEAVKAGIHMIDISHTASLVEEAIKAIEAAVLSGEIAEQTIDDAVKKIIDFKTKYIKQNTLQGEDSLSKGNRCEELRRISRESISFYSREKGVLPGLGSKRLFIGSHAYRSTLASSIIVNSFNFPEYMSAKLNGDAIIMSQNPDEMEIKCILKNASKYDSIVVGTYNGHLNIGQIELVNELCRIHSNVLAVALRNPYDAGLIQGAAGILATYEYTRSAFDSLIDVLQGKITPNGNFPVKVFE